MSGQELRNFALDLLDDEQGINSKAWDTLSFLLYRDSQTDIYDAVKAQDDRWYLPSDVARTLRQTLAN